MCLTNSFGDGGALCDPLPTGISSNWKRVKSQDGELKENDMGCFFGAEDGDALFSFLSLECKDTEILVSESV